jgi:hypothetical protein
VERLDADSESSGPNLPGEENVMLDHPLPPTTHTVEMAQLSEINDRLTAARNAPAITAEDLGLSGLSGLSDQARPVTGGLPASAVLVRLAWDGPPEYPYIHGHFASAAGRNAALVVELHTAALHELSRLVGLHHRWGV